jgi:hypothetical protein
LRATAKQFRFRSQIARLRNNYVANTIAAAVESTSPIETPLITTPIGQSYFEFNAEEAFHNLEAETELAQFEDALHHEIEVFKKITTNKNFVSSQISTRQFWFDQVDDLPLLSELALVLLSILSSSAFIERFFSICGFCTRKYHNLEDDLLEMRCMMHANINILKELEIKPKNKE